MATTRGTRATKATKAPDAALAAAVEQARAAVADLADPAEVGDHEGYEVEGDRVLTHYFTCLSKGYRGWRWAVTLSRAPRARAVTVSEVVLLPGADAILAPTWVPWADRLAPGDLGQTDTLPYRVDDPRLEPGYTATDGSDEDEDADRVALWELGLGRVRVLSPEGRAQAAQRWFDGPNGPTAESALHAPCQTCGFYLPLAGSLRLAFGVCANEWSPSDGQVVSAAHGCGAHSETDVERTASEPLPSLILDEIGPDAVTFVPRDLTRAQEEKAPEDKASEGKAPEGKAEEAPAEGEAVLPGPADSTPPDVQPSET